MAGRGDSFDLATLRTALAVTGLGILVGGLDFLAAGARSGGYLPGERVSFTAVGALPGSLFLGALALGACLLLARWWPARGRGIVLGAFGGLWLGLALAGSFPGVEVGTPSLLLLGGGVLLGLVSGGLSWWAGLLPWGLALGLVLADAASGPPRVPAEAASPSAAVAPGAPTHLVLLTLDTFRADHLGAIGGAAHAPATPFLDGLAEQGVLYTEGVSPVPLTLPAHAAMLTGLHPAETGLVRNGLVLDGAVATVPEQLQAAGWRTGAFVSSHVLRDTAGLARGFDLYDDRASWWDRALDGVLAEGIRKAGPEHNRPLERPGDETVARALRWLSESTEPTFLWVHLYDPHAPYSPPVPFRGSIDWKRPYAPGNQAELKAVRSRYPWATGQYLGLPDLRLPIARYAEEIAWTDHLVGRLLQGLSADAAVVVASDHGESLLDHGELLNHGSFVYQSTLRVPIIVRAPGRVAQGVREDQPAELQRVAPTLRWLAGLGGQEEALGRGEVPSGVVEPKELLSFAPGQTARMQFGIRARWRVATREGQEKWIVDEDGVVERYDLGLDPGELDAIAVDSEWAEAASSAAQLRIDALRTAASEGEARGGEDLEALRALGYVE